MDKELSMRREEASRLSGGSSDQLIKRMIVRQLLRNNAYGQLLDFGAGKGELLCLLEELRIFDRLVGVDLFQKSGNISDSIEWHQQDLNEPMGFSGKFDVVVCSEVIEHLENPRQVFRNLASMIRPGGLLVLTIPNQESVRAYAALIFGGHFAAFLGNSYPAHITALLKLDLARICAESGFSPPLFSYSNYGGIPKLPAVSWQSVSFGLLSGRLFSDNLCMVSRRHS